MKARVEELEDEMKNFSKLTEQLSRLSIQVDNM